jgi:hypothetical protein
VGYHTLYALPDADPIEGDHLASISGYWNWTNAALARAPAGSELAHLAAHGWADDWGALEHELSEFLHAVPDPNVAAVTAHVLAAVRARPSEAAALLVTDGEPADEDEGDEFEEGISESEYHLLSEADRSGLTLKTITDKNGKQTRRWVRTDTGTGADADAGAKPAEPDPLYPAERAVIDSAVKRAAAAPTVAGLVRIARAVNSTLPGLSAWTRHAVRLEAVGAVMRAKEEDAGAVREHGMGEPEPMKKLALDGLDVHYPDTDEGRKAAAYTLAEIARDELPPKLLWATARIVFTSQKNKDDGYWAKAYETPGFESAATGGHGTMVVYNGNGVLVGTVAHESGHNLAQRLWNSNDPDPQSEYGRAQQAEPPVTSYGAKSPAEDFADAVKLYCSGYRDNLKREFPLKYAALEKLLGGPQP